LLFSNFFPSSRIYSNVTLYVFFFLTIHNCIILLKFIILSLSYPFITIDKSSLVRILVDV